MRLATSPERWPPMPSASAMTPVAASQEIVSSLYWRTLPASVTPATTMSGGGMGERVAPGPSPAGVGQAPAARPAVRNYHRAGAAAGCDNRAMAAPDRIRAPQPPARARP